MLIPCTPGSEGVRIGVCTQSESRKREASGATHNSGKRQSGIYLQVLGYGRQLSATTWSRDGKHSRQERISQRLCGRDSHTPPEWPSTPGSSTRTDKYEYVSFSYIFDTHSTSAGGRSRWSHESDLEGIMNASWRRPFYTEPKPLAQDPNTEVFQI